MKLTFDKPSMEWLHNKVNQLIIVANKMNEDSMGRVARKMRHKFHGNPPVVFLTAKERALLNDIVTYRLGTLETQATDERMILTQISEVLNES